MRKYLLLLVVPVAVWSQATVVPTVNEGVGEGTGYLYTVDDTTGGTPRVGSLMYNRTFTSITADTTQSIPTYRSKSLWVHVAATDSCTILTKYQLSLDGISWATAVSLDSVKVTSQAYFIKSYNLSTVGDSARYVRLLLPFDTNAYAKGTTTPTYSVTYAIKRD